MAIPDDRGDESFADDLNMWPGIVSGRVALLLRSTEIQPAAAPICPLFAFDRGVRHTHRFACGEKNARSRVEVGFNIALVFRSQVLGRCGV